VRILRPIRQTRPRHWVLVSTLIIAATAYAAVSPARSAAWLQHLAASGDTGAQLELGLAYRDGRYGLKPDPRASMHWLKAAAEEDDAYAADALANACAATNPAQALHWWRLAARGGNPDAQAHLGEALLARGEDREGLEWLRAAADRGDALAHRELLRLYHERGLPEEDLHRGENALSAVAERSNDDSLKALLALWNTVEQGSLAGQTGAALTGRAQAGDPVAQYQLAMRYRDGAWGVTRDAQKELMWLKRSAQAGNRLAVQALSELENSK
jgi:TPR repeat protein